MINIDTYKVYMHIFPNNKKYVGITKQRLNVRWKNGYGYERCPLMWKAIQKYGWENIEHILLFDNFTKEQAENTEIMLIKNLKTNNKKYGYNIANGGNCIGTVSEKTKLIISKKNKGRPNKYKGIPRSEETKLKIKKAKEKYKKPKEIKKTNGDGRFKKNQTSFWKGKKLSEEHKKNLSKAHKGQKVVITEETKLKISKANLGHIVSKETRLKLSKKVIHLDTGKIYNSAREAEKDVGISYKGISMCCTGKRKSYKQTHWEFVI